MNWLYFFNVVSFYFRSFIRSLVRPFSVRALISTFALMRHSHVCLYIFLCMCMLGLFVVCVWIYMYKNGLPTQNNPLAAGLVSGSKSKRQPRSLSLFVCLALSLILHIYICVSVSVCFNESIFAQYYSTTWAMSLKLPVCLLLYCSCCFFLFCFTHNVVVDYNIYLYAYICMCMYIFLYTSICFMYLQNLLIACRVLAPICSTVSVSEKIKKYKKKKKLLIHK